jgi:hypothetical protein
MKHQGSDLVFSSIFPIKNRETQANEDGANDTNGRC